MRVAPTVPAVVGHRGAAAHAPENTLAGIREAHRQGATWVEVDVRLAACGTPVLLHDATIDRTTTHAGAIAHLTTADLQLVDAGVRFATAFAGEPLPTLADVVKLAAVLRIGLNVEIKAESDAEAKRTAIAAADVLRPWRGGLIVSSFAPAALQALRTSALPLGLLVGASVTETDLTAADDVDAASLHVAHQGIDRALIATLDERQLVPVAYTVNDPARAQALWAQGVRAVITDRPAELLAVAPLVIAPTTVLRTQS